MIKQVRKWGVKMDKNESNNLTAMYKELYPISKNKIAHNRSGIDYIIESKYSPT
jgi:hypothetical protein